MRLRWTSCKTAISLTLQPQRPKTKKAKKIVFFEVCVFAFFFFFFFLLAAAFFAAREIHTFVLDKSSLCHVIPILHLLYHHQLAKFFEVRSVSCKRIRVNRLNTHQKRQFGCDFWALERSYCIQSDISNQKLQRHGCHAKQQRNVFAKPWFYDTF